MFGLAQDRTNAIVRKILEADSATMKGPNGTALDATTRGILDKSQALYKSCMNETQLAAVGRQPLFNKIQNLTMIAFPVNGSQLAPAFKSNNSNSTTQPSQFLQIQIEALDRTNLTTILAQYVRAGIDSVISLGVNVDPQNTTTQGVFLSEGGLTLPSKEYYADKTVTGSFQTLVEKMFSLVLGPSTANGTSMQQAPNNTTSFDASKIAQDVVAFESKLANISTSMQDLHNDSMTMNSMTVSQLTQLNPAIDWPSYLQKSLNSNVMNNKNLTVSSPAYIQNLATLLNGTTPTTMQNFLAWKAILQGAPWLSSEYRQPLDQFVAKLVGSDPNIPPKRWETCVGATNDGLGSIVGHFYVAKEFSPQDKQKGEAILDAVKSAYMTGFANITWLDNQTRAAAEAKLKAMEDLIGYSTYDPDVASSYSVNSYYSGLNITPGDFYGNQERSTTWAINKELGQAGKATDKKSMEVDPQVVNAMYDPLKNQIIFPAGIMQSPFFQGSNPEYLNFGGFGAVAGHEITHGFDSNGRQYNANGTYTDWWTNTTAAQFQNRTQCFINQYSNFTVPNPQAGGQPLHVNGNLTLNENLADNGGVQMAFRAWQNRLKSDPQGRLYNNQILAGLNNYTREQLFYVAWGQVWCTLMTPEALVQQIRTNPHSPDAFRANGPLQNSVEFAKAFKCNATAPMNPANKCKIW
ncbi:hypothetical protein DFQ26_009446 [Actinomortierella ambigua]|nr:hypothetical protein DFQ26_009446 [Actinomortierella ambigua]